ncbi:MAG: hypothetical protein ACREFP_19620, partial [Acetobacteraceae bacterium]
MQCRQRHPSGYAAASFAIDVPAQHGTQDIACNALPYTFAELGLPPQLAAEGMLARRRKTGTVVTGRPPHHSL